MISQKRERQTSREMKAALRAQAEGETAKSWEYEENGKKGRRREPKKTVKGKNANKGAR